MPSLLFRHHHRRPRATGFTLLELLIVLVIGGLVMTAISAVITAEVRSQRNQLLSQQLRSDWSRFTTFLSHEVGEGRLVRTNTSSTELSNDNCAIPAGGALLFSTTVPIATDTGDPVVRNIHFYTTGTGTATVVFRCGPPIQADGRLNSSTTSFTPARLIAGIPLTAAVDANNVAVTLTPTLTAPSFAAFAVRTRAIDIP